MSTRTPMASRPCSRSSPARRSAFSPSRSASTTLAPAAVRPRPYSSPHPPAPPVQPSTPAFDALLSLAAIAATTKNLRLGTNVYNIGLRHPFVTARAITTLDVLSGGRVEFGIGSSWLEEEWDATELDFSTRGRRVDETIDICRKLWSDEVIEFH